MHRLAFACPCVISAFTLERAPPPRRSPIGLSSLPRLPRSTDLKVFDDVGRSSRFPQFRDVPVSGEIQLPNAHTHNPATQLDVQGYRHERPLVSESRDTCSPSSSPPVAAPTRNSQPVSEFCHANTWKNDRVGRCPRTSCAVSPSGCETTRSEQALRERFWLAR